MYLGSIEGGGTKFVCAIGNEKGEIFDRVSFATVSPEVTLQKVKDYFNRNKVEAVGIGSFGPIDISLNSKTYGYITNTPKVGWSQTDFLGQLKKEFDIPMYWTTDVNEAAYGEYRLGAAQQTQTSIYVTIGTGIGAGIINQGKFYNGRTHTELGHMIINRQSNDHMISNCPFHENCIEGLASGPAIEKRTSLPAAKLASNDPIWRTEANYIAQLCANLTVAYAPDVIVLNGGVMHQQQLYPLIRDMFKTIFNDYQPLPEMENYLVPAGLDQNSGIIGGLLLAELALKKY